jgi:RNA polymerase sigma factor (sigma-70 family)
MYLKLENRQRKFLICLPRINTTPPINLPYHYLSAVSTLKAQAKKHWQVLLTGNPAGFRSLYDLTYDDLYRYGCRVAGDSGNVRDALQEVFVAIWERRDQQPPIEDPWIFLLVSLRNRLIDNSRKRKEPAINHAPIASPEEEIIALETASARIDWLDRKLDELPARQREALHLRYRLELQYEQVATVLGVSQQAAYNYVNRGVKALRIILNNEKGPAK